MDGSQELAPPPISVRWIATLFGSLILLIHTSFYLSEHAFPKGDLADPDGYMWLQRVTELKENPNWYAQDSPRTNTPYGDVLHWTRPLDTCLMLGAVTLAPFLGFDQGLYYWGTFFSPCVHLMSLLVLLYTAHTLKLRLEAYWLPIIVLMQICLFIQFQVGRPDHQSLLLIVFGLSLIPTYQLLQKKYSSRSAVLAGLGHACLLWVCVEGLLQIVILYGTLFLLWMFNIQSQALKKLLTFTLSLITFTGLVVLLEQPPHRYFTAYQDEVSILHFFFIALITLSSLALWVLRSYLQGAWWHRFIALSIVGVISAATMYKCYPNFYLGPFSEVDPEVARVWLARVSESAPLYQDGSIRFIDMFLLLGPAFTCLPYLLWLCFKKPNDANHLNWCYIAVGIILYSLLTIFHRYRWSAYAELLAVIPLTMTFLALANFLIKRFPKIRQSLITTASLTIVGLSYLVVGSLLNKLVSSHTSSLLTKQVPIETSEGTFEPKDKKDLPMRELWEWINASPTWGQEPKRMMAFINFGPEILYRTKHSIVSSPYHRNTDAILDEFRFFTSNDFAFSHEILKKRGIDLVVIAPGFRGECYYYNWPADQKTLYAHLAKSQAPLWLNEITLPDSLNPYYKLFEVKK